jgi:hypothetical protein
MRPVSLACWWQRILRSRKTRAILFEYADSAACLFEEDVSQCAAQGTEVVWLRLIRFQSREQYVFVLRCLRSINDYRFLCGFDTTLKNVHRGC